MVYINITILKNQFSNEEFQFFSTQLSESSFHHDSSLKSECQREQRLTNSSNARLVKCTGNMATNSDSPLLNLDLIYLLLILTFCVLVLSSY